MTRFPSNPALSPKPFIWKYPHHCQLKMIRQRLFQKKNSGVQRWTLSLQVSDITNSMQWITHSIYLLFRYVKLHMYMNRANQKTLVRATFCSRSLNNIIMWTTLQLPSPVKTVYSVEKKGNDIYIWIRGNETCNLQALMNLGHAFVIPCVHERRLVLVTGHYQSHAQRVIACQRCTPRTRSIISSSATKGPRLTLNRT